MAVLITLILVITAILSALVLFKKSNRVKLPNNVPPGPKPLPIIGNIHQFLSQDPLTAFQRFQKIYGDIYTVYFGGYRMVVLNDYKVIKEAFNKLPLCSRPPLEPFLARTKGVLAGLISTSGPLWIEQREFIVKGLKEIGLNKQTTERYIKEELNFLVESLRKTEGKPIKINSIFTPPIANVLWRILSGQRFDYSDPVLDILISGFTTNLVKTYIIGPVFFFPWICQKFPKLSGWDTFSSGFDAVLNLLTEMIEDHKKTFKLDQKPRDFIDVYYKKVLATTDPESSFYKERGHMNLAVSLQDLFIVASEATSTTAVWAFLYLATQPKMQNKIREETMYAMNETGIDSTPCFSDRVRMPYTEAFILEVLRHSAMSPLGAFHWAEEDTEVAGFTIPANTVVTSNLHFAAMDERYWKDPQTFKPERFLTDDGHTVVYQEQFVAFSTGKRVCIGEVFAKDQIFLMLTTVLKHFEVQTHPDFPIEKIEFDFGAILVPKPYPVVFKEIIPIVV